MLSNNNKHFHRTEIRQSRPFPEYSNLLSEVQFSPFDKEGLDIGRFFVVDQDSEISPVLKLPTFDISDEWLSGISEDIDLTLLLRFPTIRNTIKVASWPLSEAPSEYVFPDGYFDGCPNDFELSIFFSSQIELDYNGYTIAPYSRLGTINITVQTDSTDNDFTIQFVEPEELAKAGYHPDSLWVINCINEDFNCSPIECFEVLINKKTDGKLQGLAASGTAGKLFMEMLATEVEFAIACEVLKSDQQIESDSGILAFLVNKLGNVDDKDQQQLKEMAFRSPNIIRSYIHSANQLTYHIEAADVRRRRQ